MIARQGRIALLCCLAMFFPVLASVARGQSAGRDADAASIRQVVANYSAAFNRRDAHAEAMCFTADADMMDPSGVGGHGTKEIEHFYATIFAGRDKAAHRVDTVKKIKFLSPDVAAVENAWTVTNGQAADGSTVPPFSGLHAWVMVKQNGHWLIAVFHGIRLHTS